MVSDPLGAADTKAAPLPGRLPLKAIDALCIGLESIDFPGGRQSPTQSDADNACGGARVLDAKGDTVK
jgi:hypothetical protein